jgi:RNA polymerase sigma-70 factor (ECF subfamily)
MRPELTQATELLRRNTPEAIEEAIGLLQNTVYSFSMKVCGHPEDAEDTMQEVLFRSLPYLAKIQDAPALAVWLYTVTRNRCWRMRRKSANAPRQTVALDELMPDGAELGRLLEDAAAGPEDNLLHAEQALLLHQAALRIPAPLRMVLVLHDMEELSTDQVATILGLQAGTVRVRLHRARLYVRKEMAQLLQSLNARTNKKQSPTKPKNKGPKAANAKSAKRPAECRELFANLSEYMDGHLQAPACDQMRAHIEACPACVAFLRELRTAIDRCRSLDIPCDSAVALHLRSILTQEYLRMLGMGTINNLQHPVTKSSPRGFHKLKKEA